jgi:hypothetical protein
LQLTNETGVVFRVFYYMFEQVQALLESKQFQIRISMFQIYKEGIYDLLAGDGK